MFAKNVVQWQGLNREVVALMDLPGLRREFMNQHTLGLTWVEVRHDALLIKDCLRDLGVALNVAMRKPVKIFATPHAWAFMQAVNGPFGEILKPRHVMVGPVYIQTCVLIDCLDRLAAERPGKALGYAFIKDKVFERQEKSVPGTVLMMGTAVVGGSQSGEGRRRYPDKPVFKSTKAERQAECDRGLRQGLEGPDGGFVEDPLIARFRGDGSREEVVKTVREIGLEFAIRF